MEDLAHFIQSMSEKYGLLDGSHKQQQIGNNQSLPIQDHSSSAASNNFKSDDCQGSSWECLSIFISGSQSIDCKSVPAVPNSLPSVGMGKNLLGAPPSLRQQESVGSPIDGLPKLIDISEHVSPRHDSNGNNHHEIKALPNDPFHHKTQCTLQSEDTEGARIYDSCEDLSTILTMSDYIQQSYLPTDEALVSKSLGSGHFQNSSKKLTSIGRESPKKSLRQIPSSKASKGVSARDLNELHTNGLGQEVSNTFEHKPATTSASGQSQEQQTNGRRRGVSLQSVGLSSEAELGDYDIALLDYDISSGRTSRDTHTGIDTDIDDCRAAYQTKPEEVVDKEKKSGGRNPAVHNAVSEISQSLDFSQFSESSRDRPDIEQRESLGNPDFSISNDLSPENQQGNYGESSPVLSSEYLPVSAAMQSRVAQLEEVSKEFFPWQSNSQTSSQVISGVPNSETFRHSSPARSQSPMMKKARSVKDFSFSETKETERKIAMKKGSTSPSKMNSAEPRSKRQGVSFKMPLNAGDNTFSSEENKLLRTSWGQDDDLIMGELGLGRTNVEGGARTREPNWSAINKFLCDNGFSPLDRQLLSSSKDVADTFFQTLQDVVRRYESREKVVQELLAERESLVLEEQRSNEILQKMELETDMVKRKLAMAVQSAELANAAAEKTCLALRKDNHRLEVSHASMLQRCSQLEHGSRAKERAIRKLQEKIQEAVEREKQQRAKEKDLYEKLKHKIAGGQKAQGEVIESNFLLKDLKPATIVGVYERQRAAAEAEMNLLREENVRLCQDLRQKENSLLAKMQETETIAKNSLVPDIRERELLQQLTKIDKLIARKTSRCRNMACRGDHALLPLAINQADLKKDMAHAQSHSCEEENTSKSLIERMKMDAANGRKSPKLQDMSQKQEIAGRSDLKSQEFLQDICSRLKVTDPIRIPGAIDGLLKVVAAVPRMETFIEHVCETVFNEGSMFLSREGTTDVLQTPEAVPSILTSWLEQLQTSEELQQFKDTVASQLWERYDDKAAKHAMSSRVAAASVKDLIDVERRYLLSEESYRDGEMTLKAEPQKLLHRIISHFQMLFEIPKLEGVMAVMNSVYIQISEYHNFARAICSMLSLPKDAGPNTIIATITSILSKV